MCVARALTHTKPSGSEAEAGEIAASAVAGRPGAETEPYLAAHIPVARRQRQIPW